MKILFLVLLVFGTNVFADITQVEVLYQSQMYHEAIDEAKSLTSEYSNPKLHLLWAKSAEALGEQKEAMSAYERVVILDENDTQAKLALFKIYKNSKRDVLAKETREELLRYQLTPSQRSSLNLLEAQSSDEIKAKATLILGHDTNINVSADSGVLDSYFGTLGNKGEVSTFFSRFTGSVSYVNELEEKGGWHLRGDAELYYQNNFDASYYSMLVGGLKVGMGYSGEGYTLYMPIGYDKVHYLNSDLLTQITLAPTLNVKVDKEVILNVNAKYATRSYDDKYKGMGDSSYGVGSGVYYLFDANYLYSTGKYESFSSNETVHFSYLDKKMLTFSLGVNYNLAQGLVSKLDYRYRKAFYNDGINPANAAGSAKRDDDYNQVELKLSHYFADNFELFFSERYAKNSSNYIPAKYSKNITMFGVSVNY